MRSRITMKAITNEGSNPGCTVKVKTSSFKSKVVLILFLVMLATTWPVSATEILQFRLLKYPSHMKSGGCFFRLIKLSPPPPPPPRKTCASHGQWRLPLLPPINDECSLLMVNTLELGDDASSSSPLYASHWCCIVNRYCTVIQINISIYISVA